MGSPSWQPWHKVVQLRDDLKSGELSLSVFAADLYDVVMGRAKPVYGDPAEFFALTYPTFNLRELAKDVLLRLAGKNDKAVRQLELTYGGGKTHTLITLYHLVSNPGGLPNLPAVREFIEHAGITPPRARVAVLACDKLDVEKGMAVKDPEGNARWLKQPWSILAWQLAGPAGLRLLSAAGDEAERESAPAENLLEELLSLPQREGLATLILLDEVLMYAREKISLDPVWRGRLQNFFQYLTQAATKVERCAVVVSLLASDPRKSDALGKEIAKELYDIFRREQEEGIQPVVKEDVAEVLRRRFFTAASIRDREGFRPHVVAALKGIAGLDDQTRKEGKAAEERVLKSFPFHPDLTEVFYTKWTQLEGFQRTRGVLRTFALALREAEKWDHSPLVGPNVFLSAPGREEISEAARELTSIAATESYEGKRQEWAGILEGELQKARTLQEELPGLRFRELEQAVLATFIHSQPIGQKASTRNLVVLLGPTRPDKIELEKALRRWAEASWFLDEEALSEAGPADEGGRGLPKYWRLGSKPNLKQMHSDACRRVPGELVEAKLLEAIRTQKSLTAGVPAGVRVHNLPERPGDIEDDGEFHYAVLGPKAASAPGSPSAWAKRFIDETTGPDRPRVNRNAVVLAVPSREGLEVARERVRGYLGWEEVRQELQKQEIDPLRVQLLVSFTEAAQKRIPEAVRQAYCLAVTVSEKNEVQAYKLTVGLEPLFHVIKADKRVRIQESAVSAEALLPDGPYNLWREGETARRVKDLAGAFAQFPHLPKMLQRREILATLIQGVRDGIFVLRLVRPDRSVHTIWRQEPADGDLKDPALEVVLPEAATLSDLSPEVLLPGVLPGLWPDPPEVTVGDVVRYFQGGNVVNVNKGGYEEQYIIPRAERPAVERAIAEAVHAGKLWLTAGVASLLGEPIPAGLFMDTAQLQPPPAPVPATDVLPERLPAAWQNGTTTGWAIAAALSAKARKQLPWSTISTAIDGAVRARMLELTMDSGPWPCDISGAKNVKLRVPAVVPPQHPAPAAHEGIKVAAAQLRPNEIQDLADVIGELVSAAVGCDLSFYLRLELKDDAQVPADVVKRLNQILAGVHVGLRLE